MDSLVKRWLDAKRLQNGEQESDERARKYRSWAIKQIIEHVIGD